MRRAAGQPLAYLVKEKIRQSDQSKLFCEKAPQSSFSIKLENIKIILGNLIEELFHKQVLICRFVDFLMEFGWI